MTRSKNPLLKLCPLIDFLLVLGCAAFTPELTDLVSPLFGWSTEFNLDVLTTIPFIAGVAVTMVPFVLMMVGFYHRSNLQRVSTALRQLFSFIVYYLCGIALYQITRVRPDVMNHIILVNVVLVPVVLFVRYLLVRMIVLHGSRDKGRLSQVILVGTEEAMESGWESLPAHWKKSLNVVARVVTGNATTEEVQKHILENHVGQCLLFGGLDAYAANAPIVTLCELQGLDIYIHLSDSHPVKMRASVTEEGKSRLLVLSSTPVHSWSLMCKDVLDRVGALLLLLATSPLWLFAAIGIKLSDPKGPIFYRQQRSGLYGRPFGMWKFRSMYADAEQRLEEVKKQYGNEMEGPVFKLTNDPRIFRFGHIIRKLSIDELPQLINIIKGDMSIVGPRPLPVYETAMFPEISNRRRLSVKPGLTCYWQIEGRSDSTDFNTIIEKDLRYIDNWSLWLDFTLFLRTIPAVLFGRGAK